MGHEKGEFVAVPKYSGVVMKKLTGKDRGEILYYIKYRSPDGTQHNEKVGYKNRDKMTPAQAAAIRSDKIQGKIQPNTVARAKEKEKLHWTIDELWADYDKEKLSRPGRGADKSRYERFLKPIVGNKEIHQIPGLLDKIRNGVLTAKKVKSGESYSAASVKHVLALLRILVNYGVTQKKLEPIRIDWNMPTLDNEKTEWLDDAQMAKLVDVLEEEIAADKPVAKLMFLGLLTGMRRRELMELKWENINLDLGIMTIPRPKEKKTKRLVMSDETKRFLKTIANRGPWVFCKEDGSKYVYISSMLRRLRDKAGLAKDFRPTHGLRHAAATRAALSGVPMAVIAKMLGHQQVSTTDRYLSIADVALKQAANAMSKSITDKKQDKE